MTEYDYSPAAYDRYMQTQNRIANWVSQTKAHEQQYANPFVPSAAGSDIGSKPSRHKSNGSSSTANVRSPQRSKTMESRESRGSNGSSKPSRSRSMSTSHDTRSQPRSRSSHQHSHSQSQTYYPYQAGTNLRSNTSPAGPAVSFQTYDPPRRSKGGPIHLPAPRPGETYVIIPPSGGRRVEVISPNGTMRYPGGGAQSPPRGVHVKESMLKRLLGSINWSTNGSQRSSGTSSGKERRHRRRSSY